MKVIPERESHKPSRASKPKRFKQGSQILLMSPMVEGGET
jgi:hypothetical protein